MDALVITLLYFSICCHSWFSCSFIFCNVLLEQMYFSIWIQALAAFIDLFEGIHRKKKYAHKECSGRHLFLAHWSLSVRRNQATRKPKVLNARKDTQHFESNNQHFHEYKQSHLRRISKPQDEGQWAKNTCLRLYVFSYTYFLLLFMTTTKLFNIKC